MERRMKIVSKFALALLAGTVMIAPGAAKDKKEDKAKESKDKQAVPVKRTLSKEFSAAYKPAIAAYQKKDWAGAVAAWPAAKAAIKTEDDKAEAGIFIADVGRLSNNMALRIEGVDLILASTSLEANLRPAYMFQKAAFAYDAKNYAAAEPALIQAYDAGYRANEIEKLISDSQSLQKKYKEATVWLQKAVDAKLAANQPVPAIWYGLGANYTQNKLKDSKAANYWLREFVRADGKPEAWHDAVAVLVNSADFNLQETLDVWRLARLNNAMLYQQDYVAYVDSADVKRYPNEVLSVLQEGFAKGTISKQNISFSDIYTTADQGIKADKYDLATRERDARAAKTPYDTLLAAEFFLSLKSYAIARDLYEVALKNGGGRIADKTGADQTDRANMRLALSQIGLLDYNSAKANLAKMTGTNRKAIAEYWMIYINKLNAPVPAAAPVATPAPAK
jgi:hypothetical protein